MGSTLGDAFIAAAVRCAPPGNQPTPDEIGKCLPHLEAEIDALPRVGAVVALGADRLQRLPPAAAQPGSACAHARSSATAPSTILPTDSILIGCYHPEPPEYEYRAPEGRDDGPGLQEGSRDF